jgi:hypothetical protein
MDMLVLGSFHPKKVHDMDGILVLAARLRYNCTWLLLCAAIIGICGTVYLYDLFLYHRSHRRYQKQMPPKYPSTIPYVGALVPLLWDARSAVTRFAWVSFSQWKRPEADNKSRYYNNEATVARLGIFPGLQVFLYQDPLVIRQIWKQSHLLDFRPLATHFFVRVCGMPREAAALYLDDATGVEATPLPGSSMQKDAHNTHRIHRSIWESDRRALTGPGLAPTLENFRSAFDSRMSKFETDEWVEMDDFWIFIQDTVASASVEAILGPALERLHPDFIREFFEFDHAVPWLAKGLSYSRAERVRAKLLNHIRIWMKCAGFWSNMDRAREEGEKDRYWGTAWTRHRHDSFKKFFDDDATASHDLGVIWA